MMREKKKVVEEVSFIQKIGMGDWPTVQVGSLTVIEGLSKGDGPG